MARRTRPHRLRAYLSAARSHMLTDSELRAHIAATTAGGPLPDRCHPRPVVLVHGWLARTSSWQHMIVRLFEAGIADMHTAAYDVFHHDLHAAAQIVADRVRHVSDTHDSPVDIIAHSMGGIATLEAVVNRNMSAHIHTVATLGSPYHGAPIARAAQLLPAGPLRAATQLRPRSPDLAALRAAAVNGLPVNWTCLWSRADELVPAPSAVLTAAGVHHVQTKDVGHVELLLSRTVVHQVAAALTGPLVAV